MFKMTGLKYQRVILKISGSAFAGKAGLGIDLFEVDKLAQKIRDIKSTGVELGLVVGGGNIARGRDIADLNNNGLKIEEMTLHNMGMLGSVLNGLSLLGVSRSRAIEAELLSRVDVPGFVTPYNRESALSFLREGKVVIFVGGTGIAFVTHDTAVAQLSLELNCEILLKGTNVAGIFDKDPHKDKMARKFEEITYKEILERDLKVMDSTAFALCQSYNLPIIVFNINEEDAVKRILQGEKVGTLVRP